MSEKYTLKLTGPGMSIDRELTYASVQRILPLLFDLRETTAEPISMPSDVVHSPADGSTTLLPTANTAGGNARQSIGEFFAAHNAKRNPERIACIGAYLKAQGRDRFTPTDVKEHIRLASLRTPGNVVRDMSWAVRNNWIARDSEKWGSYYLTQQGREAVESNFPPELKRQTKQQPGRKVSRQESKTAQPIGSANL